MDVVFGDIKGKGEKYENDLNEAKYYSQVSGTKNYIEKLESQGKSPEEAKKLVEQFMSKNEDIDATQAINKEILARVYQSYVDQIIKNPTLPSIKFLLEFPPFPTASLILLVFSEITACSALDTILDTRFLSVSALILPSTKARMSLITLLFN